MCPGNKIYITPPIVVMNRAITTYTTFLRETECSKVIEGNKTHGGDLNNIYDNYYDELDSDEGWPLSTKFSFSVGIFIIFILNLIGNILTLVAFSKDAKLRTVHNYYICNLAISDLAVGLSSIPFYGIYTVMDYHWPFSYTFCKLWLVVDFWICAQSSLTVILISYDRLQMVTKGKFIRL